MKMIYGSPEKKKEKIKRDETDIYENSYLWASCWNKYHKYGVYVWNFKSSTRISERVCKFKGWCFKVPPDCYLFGHVINHSYVQYEENVKCVSCHKNNGSLCTVDLNEENNKNKNDKTKYDKGCCIECYCAGGLVTMCLDTPQADKFEHTLLITVWY